jgi:NAD(P)-dependent dehydrogenase (short-subunit alcohol dehydrogenase family)
MDLSTSTALVTGANRGLGLEFTKQLLARGATVYGASRSPEKIDLPGVIPVALDVTDSASIAAAVKATGDISFLVNNAGISTGAPLESGPLSDFQAEMDVHYFGTLQVTRAFAPKIRAVGSGAVLNVLSATSWISEPYYAAYAAAKAAEWSLTNALRVWLAEQGTLVTGLHVGAIDTDMVRKYDVPKHTPERVVRLALEGVESGAYEVIMDDDMTVSARKGLSLGVEAIYPQFARS